jgi:RHS repeat-associated protein
MRRPFWSIRILAGLIVWAAASMAAAPASAQPAACTNFTDPNLSGIPVKAVHMTELGTCINALRSTMALPAFAWTSPAPAPGVMIVAAHVTDLRVALASVYTAAGQPAPGYPSGAIVPGVTLVTAAQISELRTYAVTAPQCSYSVSPTSMLVSAAATTRTVQVTTASGCLWEASTAATWFTLPGGAGGTGNTTITLAISANTATTPRSATLTISGNLITVEQAGAEVPDYIVFDSFTGANGTLMSNHPPDIGSGPWNTWGATVRLQGNAAAIEAPAQWVAGAYINSGVSDAIVSTDWLTGSGTMWGGLALRYADGNNYLLVRYYDGQLQAYRVQNNSPVYLGGVVVGGVAAGQRHRIAVRLSGPTIEVSFNGTSLFTVNEPFQSTATRHGIAWIPAVNTTATYDDFVIAADDGPVITGPLDQLHREGMTVEVPIEATAPGGAALTYSAAGLPPGLFLNSTTGVISGTLTSDSAAIHMVTVQAAAGAGSAYRTFRWVVQCPLDDYSVSPLSYEVPPFSTSVGEFTVAAPPACPWVAASNAPDFITVTSAGNPWLGNGPLQFYASNNTGAEPRVGSISVGGRTVLVTQAGALERECAIFGGADVVGFQADGAAEGGPTPAQLQFTARVWGTDTPCVWMATASHSWIQLPGATSGTGAGALTITVDRHYGSGERFGYVAINGRSITIQQQPDQCTFDVSPLSFDNVPASEADPTRWVEVTAPNGCGWDAQPGAFVDIYEYVFDNGAGSGTGRVRIRFGNNPQPFPRTGAFYVAGKMIQVTQLGVTGVDPGGEVSYFHTDALGSVRMVTNAAGESIARYDFLPFGQDESGNPSVSAGQALRFTGAERDKETEFGGWSLDYLGARYYQSQTGRFASVDPEHVSGNLVDPQSWNGYAYARNNPLGFVDPFGLKPCKITLTGDAATAHGVPDDTIVDGECVEGKAGTGQLAFDYPRWLVEDAVRSWWAWRTDPVPPDTVMGEGILPIGGVGAGLLRGALTRAGGTAAVSETTTLITRATMVVGNKGAVASSQAAALQAAEEWVGIGARVIRSRSGQIVGKISADGQRVYRTTSINKAQPYINLESKASGGNLHIRW